MADITLYHMPRACSRVTMNALEEAGLSYDLRAVNIFKFEQKTPDYLKIHPGGKVPAFIYDGRVMTENAAILMFIHTIAPHAGLLPAASDDFGRIKYYSDLVWCSATFHPAIRQVRMPIRFTDGDPSGVQAKGVEYTTDILRQVEARVRNGGWWHGDAWSIVDVYVNWCCMIALSAVPTILDGFPGVQAHVRRVQERPSFQRAAERELALQRDAGIEFPDAPPPQAATQ
ncbi:MAG: glutathione S-transferase family protein [Caulobacterales bacterium]|nr:glutathione S-transferase family protein [Caulobacterales bacterium]